MYTLQNAKEEIDAIAKHATVIADYAIALEEQTRSGLDGFKNDILRVIEAKFAELEKKVLGNVSELSATSALADLGSKVARLAKSDAKTPSSGEHAGNLEGDGHHG